MRRALHICMILAACAICLCSCTGSTWDASAFTEDETIRLEFNGSSQFNYKDTDCQLYFNREAGEFGAFTDYMTDYFSVKLSEIPVSRGQVVSGDVCWSTNDGETTRYGIALETVRLKGDLIWLHSESARLALVVKILD